MFDVSYDHEQGASRTDAEIVAQVGCSTLTVYNVRRRAVERGAQESIRRGEQKQRKARKLDGRQEAQLVALTCSTPPTGQTRWSLRPLRERLIEMEVVEQIGLETIRSTLKKSTQAVVKENVVHSTPAGCTFCGGPGRGVRSL